MRKKVEIITTPIDREIQAGDLAYNISMKTYLVISQRVIGAWKGTATHLVPHHLHVCGGHINDNDWYYTRFLGPRVENNSGGATIEFGNDRRYKKIIATTNSDLGLLPISTKFVAIFAEASGGTPITKMSIEFKNAEFHKPTTPMLNEDGSIRLDSIGTVLSKQDAKHFIKSAVELSKQDPNFDLEKWIEDTL